MRKQDLDAAVRSGDCSVAGAGGVTLALRDRRDALAAANLGLARAAALRFHRRFAPAVELDDLVQEASIGLLRAARAFDDRRGVRFATLAWRTCWRACITAARRARRPHLRLGPDQPEPVAAEPGPLDRLLAAEVIAALSPAALARIDLLLDCRRPRRRGTVRLRELKLLLSASDVGWVTRCQHWQCVR